MDEFLEESDGDRKAIELRKPKSTTLIADMSARQAPFLSLIELYHKLFWELPNLSTRDVDERLQVMFDKLMEASAVVGISRNSVPSLKECCGKKRVWPDDLGKSQIMNPVDGVRIPADEVEKFLGPPLEGYGLGDFFKRVFSFLGFKPCAGCERRRRWLNSIRWPWNK